MVIPCSLILYADNANGEQALLKIVGYKRLEGSNPFVGTISNLIYDNYIILPKKP